MKPFPTLLLGAAATLGVVGLYVGPLGYAQRTADTIEGHSRRLLDHYEMTQVAAHVEHAPLRRRIMLSGPADDFQRGEIVRLVESLPGVGEAHWANSGATGSFPMPLWIEAALMALAGYAAGATLGYLIELRRRARMLDRF